MNTILKGIDDLFSGEFQGLWRKAIQALEANGVTVGATVRNRDGRTYRLTKVQPSLNHWASPPTIYVSLLGVRLLADGSWGTHVHFAGCLDDILVATVKTVGN